MTIRTYNFTFDVKRSIMPEPVFIRQNDSTGSTLIKVHLVDNGVPITINGDLEFRAMTADSQNIIADTTGFSNIDIDKGVFSYALPNQLSMTPGKIRIAYFMMVDASGNASTLSFVIFVKPAADLTPSGAKNYISIIDGLIKAFNEWNETAQSSWQNFVNGNKQIIESIDPGGTLLTEIIAARGEYETLGIREDAQDEAIANLDGELNEKADKDYINTYLSQVSYAPEAVASVADLNSKYPNGEPGLIVVDDTGHKYLFIDGAWKDRGIYQAVGIPDNSVSDVKVETSVKNMPVFIFRDGKVATVDFRAAILNIPAGELIYNRQHSAFEAQSVPISSSFKSYVYYDVTSADFNYVKSDAEQLAVDGKNNILALVLDTLNFEVYGNLSIYVAGRGFGRTAPELLRAHAITNEYITVTYANNSAVFSFKKIGITIGGVYSFVDNQDYTIDMTGFGEASVYFNVLTKKFEVHSNNDKSTKRVPAGCVYVDTLNVPNRTAYGNLKYKINGFAVSAVASQKIFNAADKIIVANDEIKIDTDFKIAKYIFPAGIEVHIDRYYKTSVAQTVEIDVTGRGETFVYFDFDAGKFDVKTNANRLEVQGNAVLIDCINIVTKENHSELKVVINGTPISKGSGGAGALINNIDESVRSYFANEITPVVNRAKAHQSLNTMSIALIADTHVQNMGSNTELNQRNFGHFANFDYAAKAFGARMRFHLGDIADGNKPLATQLQDTAMAMKAFNDAGSDNLVIYGNHDENFLAGRNNPQDYQLKMDEWRYLVQPFEHRYFSQPEKREIGAFEYRDESKKLAVIGLNSFDEPQGLKDAEGKGLHFQGQQGYGAEQVKWLVESLKAIPDDYSLIVLTHNSFSGALGTVNTQIANGDLIKGLVEAFQNSTTFKSAGTAIPAAPQGVYFNVNVDADFTGKQAKRLIAVFNGHMHYDADVTINNVLHVQTISSLADASNSKVPRGTSTINEDAFDLMTIDPDGRTIYMTRFGAGSDREFNY